MMEKGCLIHQKTLDVIRVCSLGSCDDHPLPYLTHTIKIFSEECRDKIKKDQCPFFEMIQDHGSIMKRTKPYRNEKDEAEK